MMQKGTMTELSTNHSQKLTSAEVMCYYNPIAETNIVVNAGLKGLGASLSKKQKKWTIQTNNIFIQSLNRYRMLIQLDRKRSSSSYMGIPALSLLHIQQTCNFLHRP